MSTLAASRESCAQHSVLYQGIPGVADSRTLRTSKLSS